MSMTHMDQTLTDLSAEQIGRMACLLNTVGASEIVTEPLPRGIHTHGREYSESLRGYTSVVHADPDVLADYLERFEKGEWP
jgi:hypothetical protein